MELQTVFADDGPTAIVPGMLHWVETGNGTGVMYEIYTDEDGVEVMAPLYWRVEDETQ